MGIIISRSSANTTRTATQPRWDMDASIIEAAVLSISTDNDTFRLLDLPPELVARTTSFVNSEGVIAKRLKKCIARRTQTCRHCISQSC
jgi:hypothetical protein